MDLGTLVVKLAANTTGFNAQMSSASEAAQKFAAGAKKIAGDLGQVGVAVTAFGGAMTALAATVDTRAAHSLDKLKAASAGLGVQIFDLVEPAVRSLTATLRQAADVIAGLPADLKSTISHFAELAVGVGIAGLALQKVFTLGESLFQVLKVGFGLLSAPVLAFIAALAGVTAVILVIADNWDTFKEAFAPAVDAMKKVWRDFVEGMSIIWDGMIGGLAKGLEAMGLDGWAEKMRSALSTQNLGGSIASLGSSLASAVGDGLKTALDSAERGAKKISKALGVDDALKKLTDSMKASEGKARKPSGETGFSDQPRSFGEMLTGEGTISTKIREEKPDTSARRIGGFDLRDMDGVKKLQDSAREAATALGGTFAKGVGVFVQTMSQKLGEVGSIIQSVIQGAQAGGAWGALAAIIVELVSRMKGFQGVLDAAMELIYTIVDALEPILTPIFNFLKDVLGDIGRIFKDLAPLFELLGQVVNALLTPIKLLIDGIIWLVDAITGKHRRDDVAKLALSGPDDDTRMSAVRTYEAENGEGSFKKQVLDPLRAQGIVFVNGVMTMVTATDAVADSFNNLNDKLSESLYNIPTGVKVALARFNATTDVMAGGANGKANDAPYSIGPVYVNAASGRVLWDELTNVAIAKGNSLNGNAAAITRLVK